MAHGGYVGLGDPRSAFLQQDSTDSKDSKDSKDSEDSDADSGDPNSEETDRQYWEKEVERLKQKHSAVQTRLQKLDESRNQLLEEELQTRRTLEEATTSLEGSVPIYLRIRQEREKIAWAEEQLAGLRTQLEEETAKFELKKQKLDGKIEQRLEEINIAQRTIHILEQEEEHSGKPTRPGPQWLSFVDSSAFQITAVVVIISNVVMMGYQLIHPEFDSLLLNQLFLVFYIVELCLNLAYKQRIFLCGTLSVVWWNWLDLLIVVAGVLEFVLSFHGSSGDSSVAVLSYLRVLRLARLARILKVARIFFQSDLSWSKDSLFQSFIMGAIAFNTILMGLEVSFRDFFLWPYLENALLVIYTFELLVRLRLEGKNFFLKDVFWNYLDFGLVVGCIFDQWLMSLVQVVFGNTMDRSRKMGEVMTMFRMIRLLRILRLVRLVKRIPPLYTLVVGIAKAMAGMGWVMVLTMAVLYICALLGVKLVGEGWILPDKLQGDEREEVKACCNNIPNTVFSLFQAMNADLSSVEPLLTKVEGTKYVMMAFMVVTNWAIFSILTAVVSDNMTSVTEAHHQEVKLEAEEAKKEKSAEVLGQLFDQMDTNGTGAVDREEFLQKQENIDKMREITGLHEHDIENVFGVLANFDEVEEKMTVRKDDFMSFLEKESERVTLRSIMTIQKRLEHLEGGVNVLLSGLTASASTNSTTSAAARTEQRKISNGTTLRIL